jgi:hypothetical protein
VDSQFAEAIVPLVQHIGDIQLRLVATKHTVTLNVARHTVDDVRHGDPRVRVVGVVVLDRRHVDRALAHGEHALVPVDVAGEVGVYAVLQEQAFERVAHVLLVGGGLGAVHWPVAHGEDPGRLFAVDAGQVFGEPLVLFVVLVVFPAAVHGAERAAVGDEGLLLGGESFISFEVACEGPFGAVSEVGFAVQGDEVGEAVVEGVPEVADSAGLLARHAEAVLVGGEVSGAGLAVCEIGRPCKLTFATQDSCSR